MRLLAWYGSSVADRDRTNITGAMRRVVRRQPVVTVSLSEVPVR
jgi:hypothetical protein